MENIKQKIIEVLTTWSNESTAEFYGFWHGYAELSKQTGFEIKQLKKAMKELSAEHKVVKTHTSSNNSRVAGSGWFIKQN